MTEKRLACFLKAAVVVCCCLSASKTWGSLVARLCFDELAADLNVAEPDLITVVGSC